MKELKCLDVYYTVPNEKNMVPKFYQIIDIENDYISITSLGTQSTINYEKQDSILNIAHIKHKPKLVYGGNFCEIENSKLKVKLMSDRKTKRAKVKKCDNELIYLEESTISKLKKYDYDPIITICGLTSESKYELCKNKLNF